MKQSLLIILMLLICSIGYAQKVAVIGLNHEDADGFSFVVIEDLPNGEVIYFTENEYDNVLNVFNGTNTEAIVKFTFTSAVAKGNVVYVEETGPTTNLFTVSCTGGSTCGTAVRVTGTGPFAIGQGGESFYAYSDTDDNPNNGLTTIHSVLYTGFSEGENFFPGGHIIASQDPRPDYPNAIVVDGFPAVAVGASHNRVEFTPTAQARTNVTKVILENVNNYLHGQPNQPLSTIFFSNLNLASANPTVTVTASPSSVNENSGTGMVYSFNLSTNTPSDITINFSVGGTATFGSDYTQSGATTFSGSAGTVVISGGSNSATVTITPIGDTDLEPNETIILTITSGSGYEAASPSTSIATIVNDDSIVMNPLVAITGLNHLDPDGFSFVAIIDIPENTKINFTDKSFNNSTLRFSAEESVLSWTSPASIIPAGDVIVVTETSSDVFSLTRTNNEPAGNIILESGSDNFAIRTDGEALYAYTDDDNDPTNGVTGIYAVLYTGSTTSPGGTIPAIEDPSSVYLNALVVDGFPANSPGRTEYKFASGERSVLVENADFRNINNWLHAESSQALSSIRFGELQIIASPTITTNAVADITSTQALMGGNITSAGSNLVTERGVVYSSINNTPTIGAANVIKETNGNGTGSFSELIGSLLPNTTYYVQAYAINTVGTSYGGVESFTTSFRNAVWNGSESNNWFAAINWDNGVVPDANFNVIIPAGLSNYPTINSIAECNNLEIESTSGSTGSLLGQVNLTVNGSTIIKRYMNGEDWHMVSSPAPGQSIASFLTSNLNISTKNMDDRGMIDYDEASNEWNELFTNNKSGNLAGGKGFSLRIDHDDVVIFEGELEKGTVTLEVTKSGFGWNCIGNPFPSAIFINTEAHANNNFIGLNIDEFESSYAAIYVWEQENNAYSIITLGDDAFYAQMGQGFFVKAKTDASQIQFTTPMQTHQPLVAFKRATVSIPEIKLIAKLDNHQSTTRIKFAEGMQKNLDIGYDAGIFKTGFDLYSQLLENNGVDFGVQYLPPSSLIKEEISLGLDSKYSGIVVFSSELVNIPIGHEVVLEDRLTNTFTKLSEGQVYTTMLGQNTNGKGRFYIHITNSATNIWDNSMKTAFTVYSNNNQIYINGQVQGKSTATLYDLMGKKIFEVQLEHTQPNTISTTGIKTGIYLLQILNNGQRVGYKLPIIE